MKEMIKKANDDGKNVSYQEVLAEAKMGDDGSETPADIISRPHLARVLIKRGFAKSFDDAFDNYLADGKPFHVNRFTLSFDEWIEQVHAHRGLITWAHPLVGHDGDLDSVKKVANELVKKIDGIEIFYRYDGKYVVTKKLQEEGTLYLETLVVEHDLLRTAGGDYHEENVGFLGGVDLPEEDWVKFKNKLFGTQ